MIHDVLKVFEKANDQIHFMLGTFVVLLYHWVITC